MTAPARLTVLIPQAPPDPSMRMAATLSWFLIDLLARGMTLDTAEATLREGIRTQTRALRDTGLAPSRAADGDAAGSTRPADVGTRA